MYIQSLRQIEFQGGLCVRGWCARRRSSLRWRNSPLPRSILIGPLYTSPLLLARCLRKRLPRVISRVPGIVLKFAIKGALSLSLCQADARASGAGYRGWDLELCAHARELDLFSIHAQSRQVFEFQSLYASERTCVFSVFWISYRREVGAFVVSRVTSSCCVSWLGDWVASILARITVRSRLRDLLRTACCCRCMKIYLMLECV